MWISGLGKWQYVESSSPHSPVCKGGVADDDSILYRIAEPLAASDTIWADWMLLSMELATTFQLLHCMMLLFNGCQSYCMKQHWQMSIVACGVAALHTYTRTGMLDCIWYVYLVLQLI